MNKYNIGQQIKFTKDLEVDGLFKNFTIKEGSKAWVTASKDHPSLHLANGKELLLDKDDVELVGYDAEGLSKFIYRYLRTRIPIDEMIDCYDIKGEDFEEFIVEALEELGFYQGQTDSDEE